MGGSFLETSCVSLGRAAERGGGFAGGSGRAPLRRAFYEIDAAFVCAFREASERLGRGDRDAPFPCGSFPPALPFVAG